MSNLNSDQFDDDFQDAAQNEVQALQEIIAELSDDVRLLESRQKRLLQVLDLVPSLIYAGDSDGQILYVNRPVADHLGTTARDLIGRNIAEVITDPDLRRELLERFDTAHQASGPSCQTEHLVAGGPDRALILNSSTIPFMCEETGKQSVLWVGDDVTELMSLRTSVEQSRYAVIYGMAKLAESRDDNTGQHLERICRYVEILAHQYARSHNSLSNDWVATVTQTAALHDIGKVGVPDAILLKPGKLTDDERRIMQRHTYLGGDTLIAIKQRWSDDLFLRTAAEIALAHHERWDGSGYPYGLAGTEIPPAARIVAVADVYDALRSERVYKPALPHEQAREMITGAAGTHFDPAVVDAFVAVDDAIQNAASRN